MKYKSRKWLLRLPLMLPMIRKLKEVKFKGHDDMSLYHFITLFVKNIQRNEILDRANGVAFNFILAIFPFTIFLFTLIPYVGIYVPEINSQRIMLFMKNLLPASMYDFVSSTILDILSIQHGGLLTFGFLFALFLATNGMLSLMRAFNACYKTIEKRSFIRMRVTAMALTIVLAVVFLFSILSLIVGQVVVNWLSSEVNSIRYFQIDRLSLVGLASLRFIVIFIMFFFTISFIYYFGATVHFNWRFFSIGSIISTFICLGISYGFSYYITNFGSYNKLYGSIGALIALMVWIQWMTTVILVGFEINVAFHRGQVLENIRKYKKSKEITIY